MYLRHNEAFQMAHQNFVIYAASGIAMTDIKCPNCNYFNNSGLKICENCGIFLQSRAVIIQQDQSTFARFQVPSRFVKPIGTSLIVSTVALLAEVSFIYLRRRLKNLDIPVLVPKRRSRVPTAIETRTEKSTTTGKRVVSVYSERVVEERRWGRPVRRIINRMAWRSEETIET